MLSDYTYYRSAALEEELSAYLAERPGLAQAEDDSPFPLRSDRWWVRTYDPDDDWETEAARVGVGIEEMVMVVFEPAKGLSAEKELQADLDLFSAIVDQLNGSPDLDGVLGSRRGRGSVRTPTRRPNTPRHALADPAEYNRNGHLPEVLARGSTADLADL